MASAVIVLSVHPQVTEDEIDNRHYQASQLDLSGLAGAMEDFCRNGNPRATVRIADSYMDLDAADFLISRYGKREALSLFGETLMEYASVRGASRNGVIKVAGQWQPHITQDLKGTLLCPSLFFFVVRASTSLTVGDWLRYALDRFDSYSMPPALLAAFGVPAKAPSEGYLPDPIKEQLVAMFGIEFADHAKLTVACRNG